jgi:hypothetical protein
MDLWQQTMTAAAGFLQASGVSVSVPEFVLAIGLSFALSLVIGWVYQRTYRGSRYTQDYVHTLVLMGMVVTVVIMVVGDNLARAFGIFAAFSIIRFRRALPEARDVGFIFFAMAVGLTAGAQEYEFAILTTLFVCGAVMLISYLDLFAPPRASHDLRIRVPSGMDYAPIVARIFDQAVEHSRLVSVRATKGGDAVDLHYEVQLKKGVGPAELVARLQAMNGGAKIVLTSVEPRAAR